MLQYCFHEFIFSFLIAAWYLIFPSMYSFFLFSLSVSLFSVRWNLLLSALVFFLISMRVSVHQGTDFPFVVVFHDFESLNVFLHVGCIVSSNFSINVPLFFCPVNTVFSFSSSY